MYYPPHNNQFMYNQQQNTGSFSPSNHPQYAHTPMYTQNGYPHTHTIQTNYGQHGMQGYTGYVDQSAQYNGGYSHHGQVQSGYMQGGYGYPQTISYATAPSESYAGSSHMQTGYGHHEMMGYGGQSPHFGGHGGMQGYGDPQPSIYAQGYYTGSGDMQGGYDHQATYVQSPDVIHRQTSTPHTGGYVDPFNNLNQQPSPTALSPFDDSFLEKRREEAQRLSESEKIMPTVSSNPETTRNAEYKSSYMQFLSNKEIHRSSSLKERSHQEQKPQIQRSNSVSNRRLPPLENTEYHLIRNILLGLDQMLKSNTKGDTYRAKIVDQKKRMTGFEFKGYFPQYFSEIREHYNISDSSFLDSLGLELLLNGEQPLNTLSNSGRSGSFFLKSKDNLLIVKTLPHPEVEVFLNILPHYKEYVKENPDTLLSRMLGMYRITNTTKKRIYFIIMENLILSNYTVHELYDLKGSTVNRSTREADRKPGVALKDNDFEELNRKINLGEPHRSNLIAQIHSDADFLASFDICDYSFLVGIGKADDEETDETVTLRKSAKSVYQNDHGGILGTNNEIYFMGIIGVVVE
eukprot:TRINITY_DN2120_c0_g1_i2.p1 TRINITY_DN2120_c0_g1~~TRINITY_DN2120_c0_g1_i2.p1  ORF type:complete len:574 (+),score=98.48 TRINITY_DN2120_c0_g1_i2:39-1760(+)